MTKRECYFTGIEERFDGRGWRWRCSCGGYGRWNGQSEASTGYGWMTHYLRVAGVTVPRDRKYLDWMYDKTKESCGERAADIQRIYLSNEFPYPLGDHYFPTVGVYPWTKGKPRPDDLFDKEVS